MQVANLELCKTLFELSGWDDTEHSYYRKLQPPKGEGVGYSVFLKPNTYSAITNKTVLKLDPAYDLGYLLRKLPTYDISNNGVMFSISYYDSDNDKFIMGEATPDKPEDAACKLLIELIKEKVITP